MEYWYTTTSWHCGHVASGQMKPVLKSQGHDITALGFVPSGWIAAGVGCR